jgi:hypothetical protein
MCAGGNIMEKTLTEATRLLQTIREGVAMQRDWEEHISGSIEQETCVEVLSGISRKEAVKVKKEESRKENIERATHNEEGPIQGIKIRKLEELQGRSLANAHLLKEFKQMDWILINFKEIFNKRRPYLNQKESVRAKRGTQGMSWTKIQPERLSKGFSMRKKRWIRIKLPK